MPDAPARKPAVILAGNLSDGYEVIGPFDNIDAAADHADQHGMSTSDSWLMTMTPPKEEA